ncbi:soluble quino protein glucose/sorbosone dehydrogenase [Coniella lustricola]|uniref:Soluble quino protein glucose/sorbosone dehydrogenase n=1 Tax=Coniella lustricola TaxID=2025994 RepID=A0A2T3A7J5_9PEZI|nr:soluble quino protein glucose/sorbosone dehydrogenase [Coniella lustricola]
MASLLSKSSLFRGTLLLLAGSASTVSAVQHHPQRRQGSSCPTVLQPPYTAPVTGTGWTSQLIAQNLSTPRGIAFDSAGALLVVQQGVGIQRLTFEDYGGTCLVVNGSTVVVENSDLNHAIQISPDGETLYASTSDEVYRWQYNATDGSIGNNQTLVTNMSNTDHVSRTLLLSNKSPNTLLVSRGSSENFDYVAQQLSSGHSQIRAFDLSTLSASSNSSIVPYDYPSQGQRLGWGLRNSVGVAEHPVTGGIFAVENSADQIVRNGVDIHENNPGEEMNFLGYLTNDSSPASSMPSQQGGNYGYPDCFALWTTDGVPNVDSLTTGDQFSLNQTATLNDTTCAEDYVAPRLTFQAHMAPLDILFDTNGTVAYITFHGSWDRNEAVGYMLGAVQFNSNGTTNNDTGTGVGMPIEPSNSTTAVTSVFSNGDLSACPNGCFRPVGLAWDQQGRLFMSSDSTGEIWVLQQGDVTTTGGGDGTSPSSSSSASANLAPRSGPSQPEGGVLWLMCLAMLISVSSGALVTIAI